MRYRAAVGALVVSVGMLAGCASTGGAGGSSPFGDAFNNALSAAVGQQNAAYINTGVKAGGHMANAAAAMDPKQEDALGQSVGVALVNQYGLVKDPALTQYVSLVGMTMANAAESDTPFVFGVLNTNEVNAYSGPGGYVFVTKGALALMHDEAELAGVLGHEVTHVIEHHGRELVQQAEMKSAAMTGIEASAQAAQFAQVADFGIDAITKEGYSKNQEFTADSGAVSLLEKAGYDPASYEHFLQRLAQARGSAAGGQFMSTHPGAPERAQRVAAEIRGHQGGATLAARFQKNVPFAGR